MSLLDVIIPVHKISTSDFKRFFNSIKKQTFLPYTKVYVVDNHCPNFSDLSSIVCDAHLPSIVLLSNSADFPSVSAVQLGVNRSYSLYFTYTDANVCYTNDNSLEHLFSKAFAKDLCFSLESGFTNTLTKTVDPLNIDMMCDLAAYQTNGARCPIFNRKFFNYYGLSFSDLTIYSDQLLMSQLRLIPNLKFDITDFSVYEARCDTFSSTETNKISFPEFSVLRGTLYAYLVDFAEILLRIVPISDSLYVKENLFNILSDWFRWSNYLQQFKHTFESDFTDFLKVLYYYLTVICAKHPIVMREFLELKKEMLQDDFHMKAFLLISDAIEGKDFMYYNEAISLEQLKQIVSSQVNMSHLLLESYIL